MRYGTAANQQDYNNIPHQKPSWSNSTYADNFQFRLYVHCKGTHPNHVSLKNLPVKAARAIKPAVCRNLYMQRCTSDWQV